MHMRAANEECGMHCAFGMCARSTNVCWLDNCQSIMAIVTVYVSRLDALAKNLEAAIIYIHTCGLDDPEMQTVCVSTQCVRLKGGDGSVYTIFSNDNRRQNAPTTSPANRSNITHGQVAAHANACCFVWSHTVGEIP